MSSNSPGGSSTLATVKTLLATARVVVSQQRNLSASVSVLNSIASDFPMEDGNFTISINATAPYETAMVQAVGPMYLFFTPCLVTLGITGNVLSIYVFCKSAKLRQQSSSQYLCALAASDSVFLLQLLPAWLSTMGIDELLFIQEYCKFFVYLSYVTCTLSSWLVLAFTVERSIAVLYPLQRSVVCTVRRSRCIIVALTIGSLVFNLPIFEFAGTSGMGCGIAREKLKDAERFNWADTTVVFTVPLLVILCLNVWIAVTLFRFGRMRLKLLQEGQEDSSKCSDPDYLFPRLQRRITNMLLLVSSVFFVFNVPAYVMRVFAYSYDWESSENSDTLMALHTVSMILFYSTFGINFFLYCLSGQNFRRALMEHVPCFSWLGRQVSRFINRTRFDTARVPSVTSLSSASAASIATEAIYDVSSVRKDSSRPQPYTYRQRFNDRWQQEQPAGGEAESFEMQEIGTPRAGPARPTAESPPLDAPDPAASYALNTQRPTVSRRIMLSRVVTAEESKYAHLIRHKKLYALSGAEKRKAQSHLYD